MTAAVLASLLGGAAVGSLLTVAYNVVNGFFIHRRENRHRFAETKLDLYRAFIVATTQEIRIRETFAPAPDWTTTDRVRMRVKLELAGRRIDRINDQANAAKQMLMLVADPAVDGAANAVSEAESTDEISVRLGVFVLAARRDLRTPALGRVRTRLLPRAQRRTDQQVAGALKLDESLGDLAPPTSPR